VRIPSRPTPFGLPVKAPTSREPPGFPFKDFVGRLVFMLKLKSIKDIDNHGHIFCFFNIYNYFHQRDLGFYPKITAKSSVAFSCFYPSQYLEKYIK